METSQNEQNKAEFSLDKITNDLLSILKARPKEILQRRFGLLGSKPQVLDGIGSDFGVTRERVRQIEKDSFDRLKAAEKTEAYQLLIGKAIKELDLCGGFCEKRLLKSKIKQPLSDKERNQLMFILNSSAHLSYTKGSLTVGGFWFLKEQITGQKIIKIHDYIFGIIKEKRSPMSIEEIIAQLRSDSSPWKQFFFGKIGKKRLEGLLHLSRVIESNILDEWGLKNWRQISERGSREKAYIILKKYHKPYHFIKITNLINKHWKDKVALPQTVHNELIKDKRFVLVGRGIYGLRDWGYDEGTVKEIIVKFLKNENGPVDKNAILEYVLTKKKVKKTTIMVNLADRNMFQKDPNGLIMIKVAE